MTMPKKGSRRITFYAIDDEKSGKNYRWMVSAPRASFYFVTIQEDKESPGRPLRVRLPTKKSRNDKDDLVEETHPIGYHEVAMMIRHGLKKGWNPSGKTQIQVDLRFNYRGQITVPLAEMRTRL